MRTAPPFAAASGRAATATDAATSEQRLLLEVVLQMLPQEAIAAGSEAAFAEVAAWAVAAATSQLPSRCGVDVELGVRHLMQHCRSPAIGQHR